MSFFNKEPSNMSNQPWERSVLEKVALASIEEQKRARRWSIFFKLLFLGYIVMISVFALSPLSGSSIQTSGSHTAVVDIRGVIMSGAEADAETIIDSMNNAVDNPGTKGLILRLNTPGGSPVQSSYVYEAIRDIKTKHPDLPVYAVVEALCASGGYYFASAEDKIFVNESRIFGSIGLGGVIANKIKVRPLTSVRFFISIL